MPTFEKFAETLDKFATNISLREMCRVGVLAGEAETYEKKAEEAKKELVEFLSSTDTEENA